MYLLFSSLETAGFSFNGCCDYHINLYFVKDDSKQCRVIHMGKIGTRVAQAPNTVFLMVFRI